MNIRFEIQRFLYEQWGKYISSLTKVNDYVSSLSYSKALYSMPTILMVVKPPIYFNESYKKYRVKQNEPLRFFLYDKETSLIVSCISEIFLQENWKESLSYMILTAEDRLNRSECPKCKFWLVERENELRQRFMGCSGYPDCNFTANIHDIYDDYEF